MSTKRTDPMFLVACLSTLILVNAIGMHLVAPIAEADAVAYAMSIEHGIDEDDARETLYQVLSTTRGSRFTIFLLAMATLCIFSWWITVVNRVNAGRN